MTLTTKADHPSKVSQVYAFYQMLPNSQHGVLLVHKLL